MVVNPILVVDDNEQIVDILSQYIKKEGWPMLAARTGEEALYLAPHLVAILRELLATPAARKAMGLASADTKKASRLQLIKDQAKKAQSGK